MKKSVFQYLKKYGVSYRQFVLNRHRLMSRSFVELGSTNEFFRKVATSLWPEDHLEGYHVDVKWTRFDLLFKGHVYVSNGKADMTRRDLIDNIVRSDGWYNRDNAPKSVALVLPDINFIATRVFGGHRCKVKTAGCFGQDDVGVVMVERISYIGDFACFREMACHFVEKLQLFLSDRNK